MISRTVGMNKFIGHHRDGTGIGVEAVDLILQTWGGSEILYVAIDGIGEVDFFVLGVNRHVV